MTYSYKAAKKEQNKLPGISINFNDAPQYDPMLEEIHSQYPSVPHPHDLTWYRSDENAKQDAEWSAALDATATALSNAATACRQINTHTERTAPDTILRYKTELLQALSSAEHILAELEFKYPLPQQNLYTIATQSKALQDFIPRLLLNTSDRIILWLPTLPAKSRAANGHIFAELKGLLRANTFASFPYWHCDFIHVFREDCRLGVRDVDNYPYKPIIDALVLGLSTRDSTDHFSCAMYNHFSSAIKPGCYISICRREEKVQFFTDFDNLISSTDQ